MPDETNDGGTSLTAQRQSSHPQAAFTTALMQENLGRQPSGSAGAASAGRQLVGIEKRQSPRYKCDGIVELREEGCDASTWANFTDVSLHGCYVEGQATYPVGTALHLRMEMNGIRFESKGNVRVCYPCLGMGIAFANISDENRARLKAMLGSVSRSRVIVGPGVISALPSSGPMERVPLITDPLGAIQAVINFFEARHMLTREEFVAVLRKSQALKQQ
jgi:hypothetical protein